MNRAGAGAATTVAGPATTVAGAATTVAVVVAAAATTSRPVAALLQPYQLAHQCAISLYDGMVCRYPPILVLYGSTTHSVTNDKDAKGSKL